MPIPKNRLVTSRLGQFARHCYRDYLRTHARAALPSALPKSRSGDPSFLIIGSQKGGTTSLYDAVAGAVGHRLARRKEVHYWDQYSTKSHSWYRAHFFADLSIQGEATPEYLETPGTPGRVKSAYPDIRLIAILRDPVSRAISHYYHERDFLNERRTLREALDSDIARFYQAGMCIESPAELRTSYVRRGLYSYWIDKWLDHFDPEQLLVVCQADFHEAVLRTLDHIGAKHAPPNAGPTVANRRPYPPPPRDVVADLTQFFRENSVPVHARIDWGTQVPLWDQ